VKNSLERLVSLRNTKLLQLIQEKNLDGRLLTRIENVRYASGFRPVYSQWFRDSYIAILNTNGNLTLLVTSGDYEHTRKTMPWIGRVLPLDSRRTELIEKTLREEFGNEPRVGYDTLDAETFSRLKASIPDLELSPLATDISKIRAVKLPEEIRVMERGAKITEQAIDLAARKAKEGMKECELSALAEAEARSLGAEGIAWSFATFSGAHAGLMYRYDSTKLLKRGEFLIMGYATTVDGYNTDITTTTVVGGSPSGSQKRDFIAVFEAYESTIALASEGTSTRTLSEEAAKIISDHGIKKENSFASFQPLLHGLGMNVYEPPLSPDPNRKEPDYTLTEGNVLAIEPAIAFFDRPSRGGIRLGETIAIGKGKKPGILGKMPERAVSIFSVR
jgi:Xaa-Pro aminopeptidase